MIVRVPVDVDEANGEFRDYRIGAITALDPVSRQAQIRFEVYAPGESPHIGEQAYDESLLQRCHVAIGTSCQNLSSRKRVTILACVGDTFIDGQFAEYYVEADGWVLRLSERDLLPPSHSQDVNPHIQLRQYELQNPMFRLYRDQLVSNISDLRGTFFGLEDLIGARVLLLPLQAETITQVLSEEEPRYLLADEVGLGKTIEACVILKGLMRRRASLKTLIIVPKSLLQQWYYELDEKFWLRFATRPIDFKANAPGLLISAENLEMDDALWDFVRKQSWQLLITDESHHLAKHPALYERVYTLSRATPSALILSATPIQRRAEELLYLLRLLEPDRYAAMQLSEFDLILQQQARLRPTLGAMQRALNPRRFDPADFIRKAQPLIEALAHDTNLTELVQAVKSAAGHADKGASEAAAILHYISANYRLENRMIRNRRATLEMHGVTLPMRSVNQQYVYEPDELETSTHEALYRYIDAALETGSHDAYLLEWLRVLFHGASSNPDVLVRLLQLRMEALAQLQRDPNPALLRPASPYDETARIGNLIHAVASFDEEVTLLEHTVALAARWQDEQSELLKAAKVRKFPALHTHRLVEVVRAIQDITRAKPNAKILVFSSWQPTLAVLKEILTAMLGSRAIAEFHIAVDAAMLQSEANKFQVTDFCNVLLCDELGGEGRNFQTADCIFHIDLPWTPAVLEQRIGRVDRLGREGSVPSYVFYADQALDHALYRIWQDAFELFTRSMSGMEIALENVQDELIEAFADNPRNGLSALMETQKRKVAALREVVEEERYFEDAAIDSALRIQFQDLSRQYITGEKLRSAVLGWATIAGLRHEYDDETEIVAFKPKEFNPTSMKNAKFFNAPNMEDAYARGSKRQLVIKGTFNRATGVRREDLVFFAPGTDVWTDTIIQNALEADRGRCCATGVDWLGRSWRGFDLLYSIRIDPRALYARGYSPTHLLRAGGYLSVSTYRILINEIGEIVPQSDPLHRQLDTVRTQRHNKPQHLGKRGSSNLERFKTEYPPNLWQPMVDEIVSKASATVHAEFEFMQDEAENARVKFDKQAAGMRARQTWLERHQPGITLPIVEFEQVSEALIEAIRKPLISLESVCFWILSEKT